jgi:AAA domain
VSEHEDFGRYMPDVARILLGEPNKKLSTKGNLRYGKKGSVSVDLAKGTFYDHEANEGGGVKELIETRGDVSNEPGAWLRWLGEQGLREDSRPNGGDTTTATATAAEFDYRDESGELLFQVVRTKDKKFLQRQRVKGEWIYNVNGVRNVPYRLRELIASDGTVFIPEGEKHVDALRRLKLVATCNVGGAGKWKPELNQHLKGRDVVLLPDNDEAGRKHVNLVGAGLRGTAARVRVLALPGLKPKGDVIDWLEAGGDKEQLLALVEKAPDWEPPSETALALPTVKHGDAPPLPPRWLVRNRIPETGAGLLSGQWGTHKTFLLLDMAAHIMMRWSWTGEPTYRQCGILLLAPEGAGSIAMRLAALVEHMMAPRAGNPDMFHERLERKPVSLTRLPIEWASTMPLLLAKEDPLPILTATALAAHQRFTREFGLPLGLIGIDTMSTGAGWTDENDNAEAAKVMAKLRDLSAGTGAVVVGVDHLGKNAEAGSRGASAKEANADFVLAVLGERETSGAVTDPRLALRKMRDGPQGQEIPFEPVTVDMGKDEYGFPITSIVIKWDGVERPEKPANIKSSSERQLHDAMAASEKAGKTENIEIVADGGEVVQVRAVRKVDAQAAFKAACPETLDNHAANERWRRGLKHALLSKDLVAGVVGGVEYLWYPKGAM